MNVAAFVKDLDYITGADLPVGLSDVSDAPLVGDVHASPSILEYGAPCGIHAHRPGDCRGWSAAAWQCYLSMMVGQDIKAVTCDLRESPKFKLLRESAARAGHILQSDPDLLPWLAAHGANGQTHYEMIRQGADVLTILNQR